MTQRRPQHGCEVDLPNLNQRSARTVKESQAPISSLSPTDRTALIECCNNYVLYKQNGVWLGSSGGKPISGNTVANLGRDGLLTVTKNKQLGSARLTERGKWFARTLIAPESDEMIE
jgi:hypothetical protein